MRSQLEKDTSESGAVSVAPERLADTFSILMPDGPIEIREGYADVGDQSLHYVEAGDGPLLVLLHGFPEFWFGWRLQIQPLAAAGFRVVAPDMRGYNLSSKPEGFEAYGVDLLAADIRGLIRALGAESAHLVGHDWGGSIAWTTAMNHPEVVDRLAILNAAHPRKLSEGLHHPSQLRKSWYFFFFATPGLPEDVVHARDWHFFRHFLERREPALHAAGDRALRRGVVAARGRCWDDQLLPRVGEAVPEGSRRQAATNFGADTGHLGRARFLPRLRTRRARPRRRAQPRPGRAPPRRVALGPSRSGRTRQSTAHRLLRLKGSLMAESTAPRYRDWSCSSTARSRTRRAGAV